MAWIELTVHWIVSDYDLGEVSGYTPSKGGVGLRVTPRIPVLPDWRIRTGFRDARPNTGTLYLIFFFFLKQNWYLWVWPTSYNRVKISYTFTESHLHIQN